MSDNGYFTPKEQSAIWEFSDENHGKRFIRLIVRFLEAEEAEDESDRWKTWEKLGPLYEDFAERDLYEQATFLTELLRVKKDGSSVRELKTHVEKLIRGAKYAKNVG